MNREQTTSVILAEMEEYVSGRFSHAGDTMYLNEIRMDETIEC